MNDVPPSSPKPTSARKAASNRRNAQKSTGPRTTQGKANSRLNALKHGILASNSVIATIEGREHRGEFEALVHGLAADFQPVGTFEQLLVEDIAGSFWRKRRLLRFETRAAFGSRHQRIHHMMRNFQEDQPLPVYAFADAKADADDILEEAHLGLDLPSEGDCMRVVRYEGSITRTMRLALAELRRHQAARKENAAANPSAYADRDVVIDKDAMKLNAGPGHVALGVKKSLFSRALEREREREEEEAEAAANPELAESRQTLTQLIAAKIVAQRGKKYETKPNSSVDTDSLRSEEHREEGAAPGKHGQDG